MLLMPLGSGRLIDENADLKRRIRLARAALKQTEDKGLAMFMASKALDLRKPVKGRK